MLTRFFDISECWKHCLRLTQMYPTYLSGWNTSFRPNTNFSDFQSLSSNGSKYELLQGWDLEFYLGRGGRGLLQSIRSAVSQCNEPMLPRDGAFAPPRPTGTGSSGVPADSAFLWYPASAVLTVPDTRCPPK